MFEEFEAMRPLLMTRKGAPVREEFSIFSSWAGYEVRPPIAVVDSPMQRILHEPSLAIARVVVPCLIARETEENIHKVSSRDIKKRMIPNNESRAFCAGVDDGRFGMPTLSAKERSFRDLLTKGTFFRK